MRFVVDQPVSPLLAEWLRSIGHDAFHVRDRGLSRSADIEIFKLAILENRVIVTSDLDFSRIVALSQGDRPGVILFRAGNISDVEMLGLLQRVVGEVQSQDLNNSIVVVDRVRIRVTKLPLKPL